mmetsp:Transcript_131700/g.328414  ORF Transcript_131700/g.328414 Transcript_131700/m.328414 type:complete len:101 (-) Transcript_131700:154-456(-)
MANLLRAATAGTAAKGVACRALRVSLPSGVAGAAKRTSATQVSLQACGQDLFGATAAAAMGGLMGTMLGVVEGLKPSGKEDASQSVGSKRLQPFYGPFGG